MKVTNKEEYPFKFYGYKYYVCFSPLHEILTNNKKFYDSIEENHSYLISYIETNRMIAPNTASIVVDMRLPKVIKEL